MKLSKVHQELLDEYYPKGFEVSPGDNRYFHIMFVNILGGGKGKIGYRDAVFHKYFTKEWLVMKKTIEKYGITVTGHDEYTVLYDPAEAKAEVEAEAKEAKAEADAREAVEAKMAKARAAKVKSKSESVPEAPQSE